HYSIQQRTKATDTLHLIGKFMKGITIDNKALPENLKYLVLSNLRHKQTYAYDELKALSEDSSITQNDTAVIKGIRKHMAFLRVSRLNYYKKLKDYKVDTIQFAKAFKNLKNKKA